MNEWMDGETYGRRCGQAGMQIDDRWMISVWLAGR
jgi:hypothetical protein